MFGLVCGCFPAEFLPAGLCEVHPAFCCIHMCMNRILGPVFLGSRRVQRPQPQLVSLQFFARSSHPSPTSVTASRSFTAGVSPRAMPVLNESQPLWPAGAAPSEREKRRLPPPPPQKKAEEEENNTTQNHLSRDFRERTAVKHELH